MTIEANFIHFWCVESEFLIKNQFHNSELGYILHIFGKLGYFWLFLTNPDNQVTVNIIVNKAKFICSSAEVLEKSQIFQKYAKHTLSLMSNYEINF